MIRSFSIVAGLAMAASLAACAATSAPDAPPVDESLAPAPLNPLPTDLPSVFARLAGEPQPRPAAAWQPRKGQP